jgi:CheY-like chemotaxis protein
MAKLKVALLEDNKALLKDLKALVEETDLVEVVAFATSSQEFFEKLHLQKPDAILLDIDLCGDSMNGLDIANQLKLPVLFVSGKTKDFYMSIEDLNLNSHFPVEHLTKPITLDKLKKILPKFINEIKSIQNRQFVYLDFKDNKRTKIAVNDIVHICTEKDKGAASGNKVIYFTNRKPEVLIDFEFVTMEQKGFSSNQFLKIHNSFRVNASRIDTYNKNTHHIEVMALNTSGKLEKMLLPVSENYRNLVKGNYPKG